MIDCSISKSRRAFGLLRTDLGTISETLAILVRRQHRISLIELAKLLPGRDPMKALFQLQTMDCVMFLAKEPAGVILTPPYTREELGALLGGRSHFDFVPPKQPAAAAPVGDAQYYEALGIQPQAALADIKAAYRSRIKQCHPDKFVGRGADFRKLAEERAKALNEAYEVLTAKQS